MKRAFGIIILIQALIIISLALAPDFCPQCGGELERAEFIMNGEPIRTEVICSTDSCDYDWVRTLGSPDGQ